MKNLIVHADDFGFTMSVSRGIIRGHLDGIVTSTSIIANRVTGDELELLRNTKSLDTGAHLTLTTGRSVLPSEEVANLVDSDGYFHKRGTPERPLRNDKFVSFDHIAESEILVEFEAQLYKLLNAEIPISHIDTHHHVHADEKVLDAVIHLARLNNLAVRSISESMRNKLRQAGIRTNDHFEGRFFGRESISKEHLLRIFSELANGITELMCHPGEISDELRSASGYVDERQIELDVLTSLDKECLARIADIHLISWL